MELVCFAAPSHRRFLWQGLPDKPDIRVCRVPDLKRSIPQRLMRPTTDMNSAQVAVNDQVTIADGAFKGRAGTVKYIHRGMLFMQVRPRCTQGTPSPALSRQSDGQTRRRLCGTWELQPINGHHYCIRTGMVLGIGWRGHFDRGMEWCDGMQATVIQGHDATP